MLSKPWRPPISQAPKTSASVTLKASAIRPAEFGGWG
jgi:hypothetical protein